MNLWIWGPQLLTQLATLAGGGEAGLRLGLRLALLVAPPLLFLEPTPFPPPDVSVPRHPTPSPTLMPLAAPETHFPFPGPSRRGSNVSLTLDMCTPGCNEEGFGCLMSPREESAREYLLSASRILQAEELHEKALDPFLLQAEFFVSPPSPLPLGGQTSLLSRPPH